MKDRIIVMPKHKADIDKCTSLKIFLTIACRTAECLGIMCSDCALANYYNYRKWQNNEKGG